MSLFDLLATTPWLLVTCAFLFALLVGSFLNVVIHRLPIMLDRQWRAQAQEMLAEPAPQSAGSAAATAGATGATGATGSTGASTRPDTYNLVTPRSACPHCGAPIRAHQNIPLISWLLLGGKCANCKAKISPRYPVVELATALLSAGLFLLLARVAGPG